jgi:hypothetical protein
MSQTTLARYGHFPFYLLASALILLPVARWALSQPKEVPRSKTACPDIAIGETELDCPWAGVARALIEEAKGAKSVSPMLAKLLPDLEASLKSDSRREAWKLLWGQSINYDELAGGVIVQPAILKALGQAMRISVPIEMTHIDAEKSAGAPGAKKDDGDLAAVGNELRNSLPAAASPSGHPLAHAGMEHTYGYLFSVLKTQFGFKRARWVEGEIEKGFSLIPGLLGARPASGTLFANVTFFIGQIAFRGQVARIKTLSHGAKDLPKALREFKFGELRPIRLDETVDARDSTGGNRPVTLHTDLIPFLKPQPKNSHLLIYSVTDPSTGGARLITAFPVAQGFVDSVLKESELGEGKPIKTRYNGWVEGVSGNPSLSGTRKVLR